MSVLVPDTRSIDSSALLEMHRRMLTIRRFEERASVLYRSGLVPGFLHLSIGQEASAVGCCHPLRDTDVVVSNHRGHGHCIAKGADPAGMMAELMGRSSGTCGGLGGSMHIADVTHGIFGANGIVGAGLPIACGAGAAAQLRGTDDVAVVFFGDGAIAQGSFHESMNLAAVWRLPVIFVCENNNYSEFSPFERQHPVGVLDRAGAYGVDARSIDGNDVVEVVTTMAELVDERRSGDCGPALLEVRTYRFHGHYEGDPERYRTEEERREWQERDPIIGSRDGLQSSGVSSEELDRIDAEITQMIQQAVDAALEQPEATLDDARRAMSSAPVAVTETTVPEGPDDYRILDAVRDALSDAMAADPSVWVAGIDVEAGNVFGALRELPERYPDRVRDTPISETALVGTGVGAAMAGTKPVVEIMYLDFIGVCFDQLMNQAAKLRFMTGGAASIPLVVRSQTGSGRSSGAQHSQSLEALLAHLPGLSVVMPSTPADTYGLLRSAIDHPDPVVVIDHRLLYGKKGPRPAPDHVVPLGKGVVRRPGRHLTIATWSRMVFSALDAAEALAADGIDAEVIDMRSVSPLDLDIVAESVEKTSRLIVAHEAVLNGGVGAEIVASIQERCFWHLDGPIARVAAPFVPTPYAPTAEHEWLPDADAISVAARALMNT